MYFINPEYLNYDNEILIMNKYLDKHTFFIKHGLFYNNKKESIHPDFLPFTDDYQNKQYLYQKQMSVDIPLVKIALVKKYPQLNNIHNWWKKLDNIKNKRNNYQIDKTVFLNYFDKNTYNTICRLYSQIISFNNHIFKATEAYRQNLYALSEFSKIH